MLRSAPLDIALGMVFTDKSGLVVFVNRHFMQMMSYHSSEDIIGKSIHEALRISHDLAEGLLSFGQSLAPVEMVIEPAHPHARLHCMSQAAFDSRRTFIGANISVQYIEPIGDALQVQAPQDQDHLRAYTSAVMEGIQVSLARLGGIHIRSALDQALVEIILRYGWPAAVDDGQIVIKDDVTLDLEASIHRALLVEALHYAFDIIGEPSTMLAIEEAEGHIRDETLSLAEDYGLRNL